MTLFQNISSGDGLENSRFCRCFSLKMGIKIACIRIRKKKRTHRKQAQKLSNWSFGKVKQYLTYKLQQHGIQLHLVDESYTSQTCPVCHKRKKTASRKYTCECGYEEHRDIHGARNILSKALYGKIVHFDVETKMKYLRIA